MAEFLNWRHQKNCEFPAPTTEGMEGFAAMGKPVSACPYGPFYKCTQINSGFDANDWRNGWWDAKASGVTPPQQGSGQ